MNGILGMIGVFEGLRKGKIKKYTRKPCLKRRGQERGKCHVD
jgi:hypothetical protein